MCLALIALLVTGVAAGLALGVWTGFLTAESKLDRIRRVPDSLVLWLIVALLFDVLLLAILDC